MLADAGDNVFLPACPGAGKTWEVVGRYLKRVAEEGRRGVALISFTNAAVNEARARCGGRSEALKAPNFVGTFDAFIHRFISTPYLLSQSISPRYCESWSDLKESPLVLLRGAEHLPFQLEWFEIETDFSCSLNLNRAHPGMWDAHRELAKGNERTLCARASRLLENMITRGIVSCSAARAIAGALLADSNQRKAIGHRLRSRFAEAIVDEMQDCGADELAVLTLIVEVGIPLVLVGDLDQAIFEFRDAVPSDVVDFVNRHLTTLEPLMINQRSTPEVVLVNQSLRLGRSREHALRDSQGLPVQILVTDEPAQAMALFEQVVLANGMTRADSIVIAHRRKDADAIVGHRHGTTSTADQVALLAIAVKTTTDVAASNFERRKAAERLERILLSYLGFEGDQSVGEILQSAEINPRWFKRFVVSAVQALAPKVAEGRREFASALKEFVEGARGLPGATARRKTVVTPREKSWKAVGSPLDPSRFASSTIHGVKGLEFPAVLVGLRADLPQDDTGMNVLDHWERDMPSEERRVLYVGCSRARDLLALSVSEQHWAQLERILLETGIQHVAVTHSQTGQ